MDCCSLYDLCGETEECLVGYGRQQEEVTYKCVNFAMVSHKNELIKDEKLVMYAMYIMTA